ncbi:hypothetical protein OG349_04305 [Streptomyces sp. NBC_01317]|uniref:hypothetical protein n=1 Tax=Streptomyces sp. NBC_01317 TaxID=2903822 RepID=UPI002E0EE1D5|nr:hypothetical protein OG349_04305 [Streptomyces sp. NBC_01317]
MGGDPLDETTSTPSNTTGGAGCLLAGLGAAIAPFVWAPRAAFSIDGGFEGHARDLSVIYVDLPLITLGGALLPLLAWALTSRWTGRPWIAVLTAVAALALGMWGLLEWWTPRQHPDPGYGPGI